MKKWFFRVILVPTLILMGFTLQPALLVQAEDEGVFYDAGSKTFFNVSNYEDFSQAIDESNQNGGGSTIYVTGDIVLEQMIHIDASVRIVSDGMKHTITTNGYTSDYGNSFRINGCPGWIKIENFNFTNGRNRPVFQVFPGTEPGKLELIGCDFYGSVCPVCYESTTIGFIKNCNFSGGVQGVVFREGRGNILNCTFSDYDAGVLVTPSIGISPVGNFLNEPDGKNIRIEGSRFYNCRDAGIITYRTRLISSKAYISENSFANCRNGIVINDNEADVCNNHVSSCSQIGIDCVRGKMLSLGNTIEKCPIGIKSSYGEITANDTNVKDCSEYGAYIEGRFVQMSGCISGARSVYQDGEYEVSGAATTVGDVYLPTSNRYIKVTAPLSEGDRFVLDCGDRNAGNVLVKVSYASGEAAEEICRDMIGKQFLLSKNLDNGSDDSSNKTVKTSDGVIHKALLRAGRGSQNTSVENPEQLPREQADIYTNGDEGSLILSCELSVCYDTSEFAEIEELKYLFVSVGDVPEEIHKSTAVYKEGFSSGNNAFSKDWMQYHNDTDGCMEIHSPVNELVVEKSYTSSLEKNTSFVFLGWCLDKDGEGTLYQTASSFPMEKDYVWYPIFDVQYDVICDGNYYNEKRKTLGGIIQMTVGETAFECANSEETYRNVNSAEYSYIIPWRDDFFLWGNNGPANDRSDFFKKTLFVTDYDNRAKIYQKEEHPMDYTYDYSYQGWSMEPYSIYKDRKTEEITKHVFTEGEYLSEPGGDAAALRQRRALFKICEAYGNIIYANGRTRVKLYLIWDEHPVLWSYDVSFTSGQVREYDKDSFLEELIKQVDDEAKEGAFTHDFEDEDKVERTVVDYDYERFLQVGDWSVVGGKDEEEFEIVIRAKDMAGSITDYPILCHIASEKTVRTKNVSKESAIYYRSISEENWMKNPFWRNALKNKNIRDLSERDYMDFCRGYALWIADKKNYQMAFEAYESGALEPYSKWYADPKLVELIHNGFDMNQEEGNGTKERKKR